MSSSVTEKSAADRTEGTPDTLGVAQPPPSQGSTQPPSSRRRPDEEVLGGGVAKRPVAGADGRATKKRVRVDDDKVQKGTLPRQRTGGGSGVEEDLRALHGSLTQLNVLYGGHAAGPSLLSEDDEVEREDAVGEGTAVLSLEAARHKAREARLRKLQRLPSTCIHMYAELAGKGVVPGDRACAAIVVTRAQAAVATYLARLLSSSS